jgi:hypothetical protein
MEEEEEEEEIMHNQSSNKGVDVEKRRRRLLGLEPIFEGGWLHKGGRARHWDVEDELTAVSLLGDVTVDLSETKSSPTEVVVEAYAILRDVDVLVAEGTRVEMSGRANNDHLNNEVAAKPGENPSGRVVRIHGHTLLGDVTVHVGGKHS